MLACGQDRRRGPNGGISSYVDGAAGVRIGYNLLWRLTFFLFAICMLLASILLLVQSLLGTAEGLLVPSSMLVAAILMSFISTRQQLLVVTPGGLQLVGDHSRIVLPWESVAGVRFKRVMLVMPYLIIALSSKEQFAQFIDENPRSFLSKWTAHVGVLRWYPWLLRRHPGRTWGRRLAIRIRRPRRSRSRWWGRRWCPSLRGFGCRSSRQRWRRPGGGQRGQ